MSAPILPISGATLPQAIRPAGQPGGAGGFQDVLSSAIQKVESIGQVGDRNAIRAEIQVREWRPIAGGDLTALGSFRLYVKSRESEIARLRLEAAQKLAEQQKLMLEARRRCRLLERLKERRFTEWTAARDREVEEIAAESYLARWRRRKPVA